MLLIFGDDGGLAERRWMIADSDKPLFRVTYDQTGTVNMFGKDGKRLAQAHWQRKPAQAPNLKPEQKDLVVLSMPLRSQVSFLTAAEQQLANSQQFGTLKDEAALNLLGSYFATYNPGMLTNLLQQRFFGREDHRLGLYVLLASAYQYTGFADFSAQLRQRHPKSPLAEYLAQHFQWANTGNTNQDFIVHGPEDGFVQRLAMARNLYAQWQTKRAVNNRSMIEIRIERQRGLESLQKLQSPQLAWSLLLLMQATDTDPRGLSDYIQAADAFAGKPGLSMTARFQAAYWRSDNGETAEAIQELNALSKELFDRGQLPPIDESLRTAFVNHDGLKAWSRYLEDLEAKLLKDDQRFAAMQLTILAAQVKTDATSESLMQAALENLDPNKHPFAAMLAAGHLMEQKQYAKAEGLIAPLLKAEGWNKQPAIWRKAAEIAQERNDEALSVARLERALQLEYEDLPDLINLAKIRGDYGNLLGRMLTLAGMADPEADLKQRAIRVADRWRVLDPEESAPCQAAARILAQLGDNELAWDYLTTPLADKPNESAPWLELAQELAGQKKIDLADRAFAQAFQRGRNQRPNPLGSRGVPSPERAG